MVGPQQQHLSNRQQHKTIIGYIFIQKKYTKRKIKKLLTRRKLYKNKKLLLA